MSSGSRFKHLRLIASISLRNLLRQRRRNILLGIAIAFSMMILVLANSFSNGITDNIFNRMIVYAYGHIEVVFVEKNKFHTGIARDKERIEAVIRGSVRNMRFIQESIGSFTRAVGNGKAQTVILVGLDLSQDQDPGKVKWEIVKGNIEDFTNGRYEYPLIVHEEKLKELNIKVGDTVRFRLETIYGQSQTARLTLVAVARSAGVFQSMAVYTPFGLMKSFLGYKPHESGSLQVILKDPRTAKMQADRLHAAFKPGLAVIPGKLAGQAGSVPAVFLSAYRDAKSRSLFTNILPVRTGSYSRITNKGSILISRETALKLGAAPGEKVKSIYRKKFDQGLITNTYTVRGLFEPGNRIDPDIAFLGEYDLYETYYANLPEKIAKEREEVLPKTNHALYPALAREWHLFPRTATGEALSKKYSDISKTRWKGTTLDVRTMYETASQVVQLEAALNVITFGAILVLFFIILIGVVNTMRMSIRERTREIGTIRAIGMQKKDVRNIFILETVSLSFFSCIAGVLAALLIMNLLSLITIRTASALGILLVDSHLYFMPTPGLLLTDIFVILFISAITAYFPSRRAARMPAARALRHYE